MAMTNGQPGGRRFRRNAAPQITRVGPDKSAKETAPSPRAGLGAVGGVLASIVRIDDRLMSEYCHLFLPRSKKLRSEDENENDTSRAQRHALAVRSVRCRPCADHRRGVVRLALSTFNFRAAQNR